jgi:hypothetical protein
MPPDRRKRAISVAPRRERLVAAWRIHRWSEVPLPVPFADPKLAEEAT